MASNPKYRACHSEVQKHYKPPKMNEIKYKQNNVKMKCEMKRAIKEIEKLAKYEAKKTMVKTRDLSTSLPRNLYKRIAKIMPLIPIELDNSEELIENKYEDPEPVYFKKEEFNESTCSLVQELDLKFHDFDVHIDHKAKKKPKHSGIARKNWQSEYICAGRGDRIKWNSKIYATHSNIDEKKLDEQAEIMMNSTTEKFTDWINSITNNTETHLSKEYVLSLFEINSGANILGTIQIEPKIMGAVPTKVAETWEMPENSIDLKLAETIKQTMDKVPKNIITHAFGRTLPFNLRPWIPTDAYTLIKPVFPDDLRSYKVIFEGISHLKAIREFVNYCQTDTKVARPQFLIDSGCFKKKKLAESEVDAIPLFELLNCQY